MYWFGDIVNVHSSALKIMMVLVTVMKGLVSILMTPSKGIRMLRMFSLWTVREKVGRYLVDVTHKGVIREFIAGTY